MNSFIDYVSSPKDDKLLGFRIPHDTKIEILNAFHKSDYRSLTVFLIYLVLVAIEKDLHI